MGTENDPAAIENLDWQASIKKGIQCVKAINRSSWALGDLALKLFPPREDTHRPLPAEIGGVARTLSDFADAIGMSAGSLSNMRTVSIAWPPGHRRPNVSWSTHRALASHPDRFELIHEGMKRSDVNDLIGKLRSAAPDPVTPSAPVLRAVAEVRAALSLARDGRRKMDQETRETLIASLAELREIADQLGSILEPAAVVEEEAVTPKPWHRRILSAA